MPLDVLLHPGCKIALSRLWMDEVGVAQAIASGELTSPQLYENVWLFDLRITGTGAAYRQGLDEYCWRDPSLYLTDAFLVRCRGLPVIVEHPNEKPMLDSDEFRDRIVGIVVHPHIKGDEVWGVAKIYDEETAQLLRKQVLSTSPGVVFRDPRVNIRQELDDGSHLLIEGKPSLLDHLALCALGVWDKGGPPSGVSSIGDSTEMAEKEEAAEERRAAGEEKKEEREERDDSSTKLDKVLAHLDGLHKRMDNFGSRLDLIEGSRRDPDKEEEGEQREDKNGKKDSARSDESGESARRSSESEYKGKYFDEDRKEKEGEERDDRQSRSRRDAGARREGGRHDEDREEKEREEREDKQNPRKDARRKDNEDEEGEEDGREEWEERDDKQSRSRSDARSTRSRRDEQHHPSSGGRQDWDEEDRERNRRDSRKDSVTRDEVRQLERKLDELRRQTAPLSDEARSQFASIQARVDSVANAHGTEAPRWMQGETLRDYRTRLLRPFQKHSEKWKEIRLDALPVEVLDLAQADILHDAQEAAMRPSGQAGGMLREITERDRTGRIISKFYGDPEVCWGQFKGPVRHLSGMNLKPFG